METLTIEAPAPRSFKGYKFSVWLDKNKGTIKTIISAGLGVAAFFIPTITSPALSAAVGAGTASISKLLLDTFDYWLQP